MEKKRMSKNQYAQFSVMKNLVSQLSNVNPNALSSESTYYETICNELKSLRKTCKLTQSQVGADLGYSQKQLSCIENAKRYPSVWDLHIMFIYYYNKMSEIFETEN